MRLLLGGVARRLGVSVVVALAAAASVLAYFTSTGTGVASKGVTVLPAPTISSATPGAGTVALSWSTVAAPGPGTVSYYVSRDGGAPEGSCPTSSAPATVTSCTDSGVSVGLHHYTVTAVWRSWTATSTTSSVTVAFGPATHFVLAATTATPTAGVADNLTVTAKDEGGNTVTTYTGSHNLTFAGAGSIGAFTPTVSSGTGTVTSFGTATAITFTNGVASVAGANNGVMKLYKAEVASVTVTDGTIGNGAGLSVTVAAAAAASFSLAAASTTPTAGEADNLTVTALDAFGNTAVSYTGSHNLTFGGASNSPNAIHPTVSSGTGVATNFGTAEAITFTNGVASVAGANNGVMRLYKAETASVTVASGAVTNGAGLPVTVSAAASSSLSLVAASITPTAGASDNLTITAKDTYGNTITSYTGSHSLTFGGPHAIGASTPTVTNSAGTATNVGTATAIVFTNGVATVGGANNGVMTLYKAEAVSVTVTDGTLSNGAGLAVTVSPAAASSLALTAASTTPTAGVADNLTVTAKDAYGNTATAYVGSHNLTFEGGSSIGAFSPTVSSGTGTVTNFGTATAITFTAGVASVAGANNGVMKLYKAEAALITVTDGTLTNGAGLSVTVAAAAAASFVLTAASTTPTAGEADNLTVTALDAFGNTAVSYTGSKNLTFGGAGVSVGGNHPTVSSGTGVATNFGTAEAITFTNGVASVAGANNGVMKLYKAETASVTVAAGAVTNGAGLSITVSVGAAASLVLAAASTTPTAGVADNLTITAEDAYGNTITTYTGSHNLTFGGPHAIGAFTPTVTNSSGTATNVGTATAVTFTNGVATVSGSSNGVMTLYKAEAVSVTVTDGTLSNGAGLAVTVGPAAAASLTLGAASVTPTAGVADSLTVTAKDAYGNTATAYAGSHNLTFAGAGNGPNGNSPTVSNSTGTVTNFGTATAITFTAGVATVAGANNGVMKLYRAEAALITVTDGTINNGAGLSVTAAAAAAAHLAWTHVTVSAGTLSSPCLFTCTVTALGELGTFTANVSVTDSFGNTVSGLGAGHTVTVTTPSSGAGSGGSFTAPSAGTSVTLTIATAGAADSTVQFTFKAQGGAWVSDTMSTQTLAGTVYTTASATLNR
jgi:hypothetical protein